MKKTCLFFFLTSALFPFFSQESAVKEYNQICFGGGKEKIEVTDNKISEIEIYYSEITVHLYNDFSQVEIDYYIKNNGEKKEVNFSYPQINANIEKMINKNTLKKKTLSNEYTNYTIQLNNEKLSYNIIKEPIKEINNPYKIGNIINEFKKNGEVSYFEEIDSYFYYYSWYQTNFIVEKNKKYKLNVSYSIPHYFNNITIKHSDNEKNYLDPTLIYSSFIDDDVTQFKSEKIFSYFLHTSYSDNQNIIIKQLIRIYSHIIDQKFVKILPLNFRKRGKKYSLKLKKLKAKPIHNIFVKILPDYSPNTIQSYYLDITPAKKQNRHHSYYEINKYNDQILIQYMKNEPESIMDVTAIRISPSEYTTKDELYYQNIPIKFKIEFSNNPQFLNAKEFVKKIKYRKITRKFYNKAYINIFRSKGVKCKYIRITILESIFNRELIQIGDIEILNK